MTENNHVGEASWKEMVKSMRENAAGGQTENVIVQGTLWAENRILNLKVAYEEHRRQIEHLKKRLLDARDPAQMITDGIRKASLKDKNID
jgi:hypothetical protein